MSSTYVRTELTSFLTTNVPAENIIDITAEYDELEFMLQDEGLSPDDNWLGLEFIGSGETPITIPATNTTGKYRETGSLFLHIVEPVSVPDPYSALLIRSETLRNLLRGQRINDILVEGVSPPNFKSGATLLFEGGYTSCSIIVNYERDLNL